MQGERWLSCGRAGWGCDMLDWPGMISINFDGWNFLQMAIPAGTRNIEGYPMPFNVNTASNRILPQWTSRAKAKIKYPITLTGVVIEMRRKTVYLDEMHPVHVFVNLSQEPLRLLK